MRSSIYFCSIVALVVFHLSSCDTARNVDPVFDKYYLKYYGKDGDQKGVDMLVNADGTLLLLGNSFDVSGISSPYLVKVDASGQILWQRSLGASNESAVDIELIGKGPHQGGMIVATNVGDVSTSRIRLIRIRQDGTSIDSVLIPVPNRVTRQVARSVTSLALEEGYAVTGYTDGNFMPDPNLPGTEQDQQDILALRIREDLITIDTVLGQGGETIGSGIRVFDAPASGGLRQYMIFGYSDRPTANNVYELNFEVITTINGIQVLQKVSGTETEAQTAVDVIRTPASLGEGFLMVGTSRPLSGATSDLYVTKYNNTLEARSLDQKLLLGKRLEAVAAAAVEGQGYLVVANELAENNTRNIFLLKLRYDGSTDWSKSFGSDQGDDLGAAVASLPDGRVAVLGTAAIETQQKMVLIILNPEGNYQ